MLSRGESLNRLIIVGSPRVDGRSAHLANMLFESCIEECPGDELALAPVATLDISGCVGCDACKENVARIADGLDADEAVSPCAIADDMQELYELIDAADELTVVSPVYFAGPPSQLKALLDRLQPYFWSGARKGEKRPAVLHVIGEGGDPHGYDALVSIVKSAIAVAGFKLETVFDWVGKIDEDGTIVADADEIAVGDGMAPRPEGEHEAATAAADVEVATGAAPQAGENAGAPEPGSSWGERGSARKRLAIDDAQVAKGSSSSRGPVKAAGGKGTQGSRPASSSHGGKKQKSSNRGGGSRKGARQGGKRRG